MKVIHNFPNYALDKSGKVYSLKSRWGIRAKPHVMRTYQDNHGYLKVWFYNDGVKKACRVHTLVLETFIGNRPDGMECRHIDGNKLNNSLSNLCWDTHINNEKDKVIHGTYLKGEQLSWSKLTKRQVKTIKQLLLNGKTQLKRLAEMYNVSITTVCDIKHGRSWNWV